MCRYISSHAFINTIIVCGTLGAEQHGGHDNRCLLFYSFAADQSLLSFNQSMYYSGMIKDAKQFELIYAISS
jgi:hypothetical protein